MAKYCPFCGAKLEDCVKYCGKCGSRISDESGLPVSKSGNISSRLMCRMLPVIAIAAVIITSVALGIHTLSEKRSDESTVEIRAEIQETKNQEMVTIENTNQDVFETEDSAQNKDYSKYLGTWQRTEWHDTMTPADSAAVIITSISKDEIEFYIKGEDLEPGESYSNSNFTSGKIVAPIKHGDKVKKGESVGNIVEPLTGKILNEALSPCSGMVFTLREFPVVYEGSLIARVLGEEE